MERRDGIPHLEPRAWEGGAFLPPLPDLPAAGSGGPSPADLDSLIGLVDQLAEIEPRELVAAAQTAQAPGAKAAPPPAAAPSPEPPAGAPPWKWQPKT